MLLTTRILDLLAALICFLDQTLGLGYSSYPVGTPPLVTTTTGIVQGFCLTEAGDDVTAFLGIPFAEPPIGDLRFKKPVPVKNWQGILEATEKPPPCMQYSLKKFPWEAASSPSEDCLFLNLWVPGKNLKSVEEESQHLKSVIVWIYGGGFYSGSSDLALYDGATLSANGNVIVASINYRVGNSGFFYSGTEDAPGNMGLYDQNLALTWIKNNIVFFGGDPNKITLLGQSAGAVSVVYHAISPLSRNLFQRAIVHSGSPFHPILAVPAEREIFAGNIFASKVGCADDTNNLFTNPKEVISCLRKKSAEELSKQENALLQAPFYFLPLFGDKFLPQDPISALKSGNFKQMEVILGITHDEGTVFLNYIMPQIFDSVTPPVLTITQARNIIRLLFQNSVHPSPEYVADFYLKNVSENDPAEIVKAISNSYGDFIFACPMEFSAEYFDKNSVYFYYFTHRLTNSQWGKWMGSAHMNDIPFVFGDPIRHPTNYTLDERGLSQRMIQMWTNFAKHGSPLPSMSEENWPKFTKANPQYLELSTKTKAIGHGLKTEACDFWRPYFVPTS